MRTFAAQTSRREYDYVPAREYDGLTDLPRRNQVYWREILYRAHLGASTALLRLDHWVQGTIRAAVDSNPLLTASGMRGLLEAAADTYQAFRDIPMTLAENHVQIRQALGGTLDTLMLGPDLENAMIHFMYGRRLDREEVAPPIHAALDSTDYVKELAEEVPVAREAYSRLCQFTHPSKMSLQSYWSARERAFVFDPARVDAVMEELVELSDRFGPPTLACGINPCALTLKVLNVFGLPAVRTEWAEQLDIPRSRLWTPIAERLNDQQPQLTLAPTDDVKRMIEETVERVTPVPRGRPPKKSKTS